MMDKKHPSSNIEEKNISLKKMDNTHATHSFNIVTEIIQKLTLKSCFYVKYTFTSKLFCQTNVLFNKYMS